MALALTDIILLADPDVVSQSRGPAVEGGKMLYTSPSAIQTADSCAEKWRLKYVERLKDDGPSGAQLIGTQIDEQIAHFIATGQNAMGPLASLGLERGYLPKPGKGVYSQVKSDEAPVPLKAAGVPLVWAIDIYDENTRRIIDVKTSSDPVKWGAKKGELLDPATKFGTQMIIYGKAIWEQSRPFGAAVPRWEQSRPFGAAVPLTLEHITFKTKGAPDVFHTVEKTTFGAVSKAFKSIEARVERMKEIAASGEAEKNEETCFAYGRKCAYFDRCHSTTQRLLAGFTGGNMGLFKELAAKNGTTQIDLVALATPKAAGVVPPDAPKAAGVVPPDAPANAAPPPIYTGPVRPRHHLDMQNSTTIAWTCRCSASFNSQNGLAAHLQELGAKTTPIVLEPAQALALAPAVNPPEGGVASATWPGKGEPTGPDAEAPAPAPKKRARPKAPDTTLPQVPAVVADPPSPAAAAGPGAILSVPTAPIPSPQAPPPSASIGDPLDSPTPGVRIFLNCFPNAPTTSLLPYIEQLQKDICAVAKLPDTDFRCVDTKPLNFGAWQGYLASAVKLSPPPPGSYSASSGDARVAVVISALEGILPAGSVVKGVA